MPIRSDSTAPHLRYLPPLPPAVLPAPRPAPAAASADTFLGAARPATARATPQAAVFFAMDTNGETGLARFTLPTGSLTAAQLRALTGKGQVAAPYSLGGEVRVSTAGGALQVEVSRARLDAWRAGDVTLCLATKTGRPLAVTVKPSSLKADETAAELALAKAEVKRLTTSVASATRDLEAALRLEANPPPIGAAARLAALDAQAQAAQLPVAVRLGELRAQVFVASPAELVKGAAHSGARELERAGVALERDHAALARLEARQAELEARLTATPGDATARRHLDELHPRLHEASREVRSGVRELQRLLSSVDVDTLARAEAGLRPPSSAADSLASKLAAVRALREAADTLRESVERAKAEQPRTLAGAVFTARTALAHAQQQLDLAQQRVERLGAHPVLREVPRVTR